MKRLLCIISCMNTGGAETFLMKLYRALDKQKYQMDFCVNTKENFYADEIERLGGRIFVIPTKSESVKKFKAALTDIINDNGYKYILRIASNGMSFMDIKIAKKAGAEVLAVRSSNSSDGKGIKQYVAHRLGKMLYGRYVSIKIAPSDLAARYTFGKRAYEKGEVNILHNAIDISLFHYSDADRAEIRKEFGIGEGEVLVGHIGRFEAQKNHSFLLDVFKAVLSENPNSRLMLVGSGSLENEIKSKAEALGILPQIIFTGVRKDIPRLLCAMDCFIFPSFYEGMPNTVIEAQATGLPCVIADTVTKEADITGLVEYIPLGDAELWAERAILRLSDKRRDTKQEFLTNGYAIADETRKFEKMIFENNQLP